MLRGWGLGGENARYYTFLQRYPIRIPPWNYKDRPLNWFWKFFDTTTDRFDEYSRLVVVDGNIGAGKTTIAKEIARKFDMLYIPG